MVSLFFSLSIKSVFTMLTLLRGSAHEIAFAAQMHENRGRVPRFSYFQREKVSAWELSDVRVLQSQNTDCRKNCSFSTVSKRAKPYGFALFLCKYSRSPICKLSEENRLQGITLSTILLLILPWQRTYPPASAPFSSLSRPYSGAATDTVSNRH